MRVLLRPEKWRALGRHGSVLHQSHQVRELLRLLLGLRALCLEQLNLTLEERNFLDFAIEHDSYFVHLNIKRVWSELYTIKD
jgi:hypothetical protein